VAVVFSTTGKDQEIPYSGGGGHGNAGTLNITTTGTVVDAQKAAWLNQFYSKVTSTTEPDTAPPPRTRTNPLRKQKEVKSYG
jgi:hypothetical protein